MNNGDGQNGLRFSLLFSLHLHFSPPHTLQMPLAKYVDAQFRAFDKDSGLCRRTPAYTKIKVQSVPIFCLHKQAKHRELPAAYCGGFCCK